MQQKETDTKSVSYGLGANKVVNSPSVTYGYNKDKKEAAAVAWQYR